MPATAADIPIELYDLILSFFTLTLNSWENELHHVRASKGELGHISLVCRAWAVACQPKIFHRIELRKREDVDALLHLMAHPTSRIAGYIDEIAWCEQSLSSPGAPWMHIIHLRLLPRLSSSVKVFVTLNGPLRPGQRVTSAFSLFPRRLPSDCWGQIQSLSLANVQFRQFRDLMRLLGEIPSLNDVSCTDVTWRASPGGQLPAPISFIARNPDYRYYNFTGCTDNAAGAWLHWLIPHSKTCRMREEDAHALRRIASALVKNIDSTKFPRHSSSSLRLGKILHLWELRSDSRSLTPVTRMHVTSAGNSEWISSVELDFPLSSEISVTEVMAHSDWTAIDEQLLALPDLDTVSLLFEVFGDLLLFSQHVVAPQMPHLSGSRKLTYGVANGMDGSKKRWTWYTSETIERELAKEAEKRSKELKAVEGTDGSPAEPSATRMATADAEDSDVVVLSADEGLAAVKVQADS